jgi:hypothetical protein
LLTGFLSGVAATLVGGLLLIWVRGCWPAIEEARQEERLIRAFWELALQSRHEYDVLAAPLSPKKAASPSHANVRDPGPVLDRLRRKEYIVRFENYPAYYGITYKGRAKAL